MWNLLLRRRSHCSSICTLTTPPPLFFPFFFLEKSIFVTVKPPTSWFLVLFGFFSPFSAAPLWPQPGRAASVFLPFQWPSSRRSSPPPPSSSLLLLLLLSSSSFSYLCLFFLVKSNLYPRKFNCRFAHKVLFDKEKKKKKKLMNDPLCILFSFVGYLFIVASTFDLTL